MTSDTMRTVLNSVCWFCVAACSWLAVMHLVLHRPGYEGRFGLAILFVLQSLLALGLINRLLRGLPWRLLTFAGAVGIVWSGGGVVTNTLSNPHFEGFAFIIGMSLVLQGLLTVWQLITTPFTPSSKVHQFGM
jgi:hypothetical protein